VNDKEIKELPFPAPMRTLLAIGEPGNRSLLFDKGLSWNSQTWTLGAGDKETFLKEFSSAFREDPDFPSFLERREAALLNLGVQPIPLTTKTRLVVGLGLPSPLETGFLFDRLTGCPYLPGSSVKGLLRATARLVRQGELAGDKPFWDLHFERIFGPEITPGTTPKTGNAIFYDAFPARWPSLELDVLTPHYGKYYRDSTTPPGDWDNPVPVPFLAVKVGTTFHFYVQADGPDFESLKQLLGLALDWLGIGAKKSSGYGTFKEETTPTETQPISSAPRPRPSKPTAPPAPPARPSPSEIPWENAELSLRKGTVTARKGRLTATCRRDEIEKDLREALTQHATLRAEVEVLKIPGSDYRLLRIKKWRS
jgi:CRISPR type III-B/RAMP module RAMP protein Cmr6